ncbi:MAG: hypothetical protein OIF50_00530 [Flavobacteriaceae bacterium]|nr:hypothetical protein [Flavobacteriaceae bacterium]
METVLYIVGLAVLFLIVFFNNKRNVGKLRDRKRRDFKGHYENKKKQR